MTKFYVRILSMLMMAFVFSTPVISQKSTGQSMTWTTKSKEAKELAMKGSVHMMNAEFEQAYQDFSRAVKADPDFTVGLVFMANLAAGQSRKDYAQKALKSAASKTEGEKLFASILDEKNTRENRQETWAKLHTMFPDDAMLNHFYVVTRATPEEGLTAAEDYVKKFPDQPGMYNNLAYGYLQTKKDTAMAKQYFDKYLSMYTEGSNPYDSMGEYYLNVGDTANAEKYYNLALEKYPFQNSSLNALQKIRDQKKASETK